MTRKHKSQTAHKKRPAAPPSKPMKSAAAEKAVAAVTSLRDKDRAKHPVTLGRKAEVGARVATVNSKVHDNARAADVKMTGAKLNSDKRLLGIERRVPVMPE